jgi:hypothetical protein
MSTGSVAWRSEERSFGGDGRKPRSANGVSAESGFRCITPRRNPLLDLVPGFWRCPLKIETFAESTERTPPGGSE